MALGTYAKQWLKAAIANVTAYNDVLTHLNQNVGLTDTQTLTNKTFTSPIVNTPKGTGILLTTRQRFTLAQVNAGATVLAAVSGYKYRLVSCKVIAIGGTAATGTTVDILATQSTSSVKLVAYAQASLTQSTVLKDGNSGATVLADGASYVQNDANTAITIGKTGASFATATNFDVIMEYELAV